MTLEEKKQKLAESTEDIFREKLLIPLFSKMGYIDPIIHHHAGEKGKDIVMKEYDPKFKKTTYLSVVVKAGDVTGSASGSSSYFALLNQVRQSLNEPYKHIYELREVNVDKVIIVISGRFLPTSLESILGTLKSEKLDRAVLDPVDINKLPALIDEHFSEYWEEFENETKALAQQRNFLLNNISKLANLMLPPHQQGQFIANAAKADINLNLENYQAVSKYVASIGYHRLDIDQIDDFYADNTISNEFANIKEHFFEIKKNTQTLLYNIDEVVQILKGMLTASDPEKMVQLSYKLNDYVSSYGGRGIKFGTEDVEFQEDFDLGVQEYRRKKEFLLERNLHDFYGKCFSLISSVTIKHLTSFYMEITKEEKDKWLGVTIVLDELSTGCKLKYYRLTRIPKMNDKEREIQIETFNETSIDLQYAINCYGVWNEEKFTAEKKAKHFLWHFERGFERMFLKKYGYSFDE